MIGLEMIGLVDVTRAFKKMGKRDIIEETMKETGERAKYYAENIYVPVDTGELKESIDVDYDENGFYLYADAKHAVFNEYGSIYTPVGTVAAPKPAKYQGFRPFLRPSIYRATAEVEDIFGKKLIRTFLHG